MLLASVSEELRNDEFLVGVEDVETGKGSWEVFIDRPCVTPPDDKGVCTVMLESGRKVYVYAPDLEFKESN